MAAYEIDGRKRLLPALGPSPLGSIGVDQVRGLIAAQAERVEAGKVAAKTVNNTLGHTGGVPERGGRGRLDRSNPAPRVERLPRAHIERDYLRLHEIPLYLDSCVGSTGHWRSCWSARA